MAPVDPLDPPLNICVNSANAVFRILYRKTRAWGSAVPQYTRLELCCAAVHGHDA